MPRKTQPFIDIIRLWKDEKYRKECLTDEELAQFEMESAQVRKESAQFPSNPAGVIELTDDELRQSSLAARICSKHASISTTWCDNPREC
jgi:mersacidin/lichenicidin family type 2 lantibiotic